LVQEVQKFTKKHMEVIVQNKVACYFMAHSAYIHNSHIFIMNNKQSLELASH